MTACSRKRPRWHVSPRSQTEVTARPFPWLQHVALVFPRVFEHAFCLCLVSFCFSKLNDGRSGARRNPLHCVNNSWFSNSFSLRCVFAHALVRGVVTPRQAPAQCFLSLVFRLLFSLLVIVTLIMMSHHPDTCALRLAQARPEKRITICHVFSCTDDGTRMRELAKEKIV